LVVLLVLKEFLGRDYRGFVELLTDFGCPIELERVPHFTTLHKFLQRLSCGFWDWLLNACLPQRQHCFVGIDSTGFSSTYCSLYFHDRNHGYWAHRFVKHSIIADVKKQLILACRVRLMPSNDNRDFKPLMEKAAVFSPSTVCADKAYDAEQNLRFLKAKGIEALIPVRTGQCKPHRTKLRKRLLKLWNTKPSLEKRYHQRSKLETIFSVIKRRLGGCLRSRLHTTMKREVKIKTLCYNLHRLTTLSLITEVFYTASLAGSVEIIYFDVA